LGALTYLGTKIKTSTGSYSMLDLRPNLQFTLWESEISYDGGRTWQQHKGTDFKANPQALPLRIAYTKMGKSLFLPAVLTTPKLKAVNGV
jgi:hypothetical protein